MKEKFNNQFIGGVNTDVSDFVRKQTTARYLQNVRFISEDGSSFVTVNIRGTQTYFSLSSGFKPVAAKEHNNVLYIISYNESTNELEIGSFPSVDPLSGNNINVYRPFSNLIGGPVVSGVSNAMRFNLNLINLPPQFPPITSLEIQPDYDRSVNLIFTIRGFSPRIINSSFSVINESGSVKLSYLPPRAGVQSTNRYSPSSLNKESSLIIYSDKILKIDYNSISPGGKLKAGNYVYVFKYMTEDFSMTGVVGQSMICQVAFGSTRTTRHGGDHNTETSLMVKLNLSNLDTDFKYLKVYYYYYSGTDQLLSEVYEIVQPIPITSPTLTFQHTGFEESALVSRDDINIDYAPYTSADYGVQIGGYYFLASLRQPSDNYEDFKNAAAEITPIFSRTELPFGSTLPAYSNPENVYRYMGYFGGDAIPFGIVFVMPGGFLTPVFPVKGSTVFYNEMTDQFNQVAEPAPSPGNWYKGIFRFPSSRTCPVYKKSNNSVVVKHLVMNMSSVPLSVRQKSIGFFFVKGEKRTNLICQGIVVPTLKVPGADVVFDFNPDIGNESSYYTTYAAQIDDSNYFRRVPLFDNIMEAYVAVGFPGENDYGYNVVNTNGTINRYLPIYIQNPKQWNSGIPDMIFTNNQSTLRHWAFYSADAICNLPSYAEQLKNRRYNTFVEQIDRLYFTALPDGIVDSEPSTLFNTNPKSKFSLYYRFSDLPGSYKSVSFSTLRELDYIIHVPEETFIKHEDFMSACRFPLYYGGVQSGSKVWSTWLLVNQKYNHYFGLKLKSTSSFTHGNASNNTPVASMLSPRPGVTLVPTSSFGIPRTAACRYDNSGREVNGAILVNIYNNNDPNNPALLYPTIDDVVYKQVTPWYTWDDLAAMSNQVPVFGGDCYITEVHYKLYQSGERFPTVIDSSPGRRWNIPQGLVISWLQESSYNAALRQPFREDESDPEERSFFPLYKNGNFDEYRKYRLPETTRYSLGYSQVNPPKSFIPSPSLAPYIENYFFSRIAHSERHVPNAFKNGYRSFLPTSYRDYDTSMGSITAIFNHRGRLFVVFNNGLGITEVEQRVLTGEDSAGSIFVKPSDVIPPILGIISKEIGCQDYAALVQTPSAIYGIDRQRSKIWKFSDKLESISDGVISSYLVENGILNPMCFYNPRYNEVIFKTDNYILSYHEGLKSFVFLKFPGAEFFARRGNEFISFRSSIAHLHDVDTYTIYGSVVPVIVEFTVNAFSSVTKILDYIQIVCNENPPAKIEVFSMNLNSGVKETINPASFNQYTFVDYGFDYIAEQESVIYRDKQYLVQIPERMNYNPVNPQDEWESGGRIRDKVFNVRITWVTDKPLQILTVISNFRLSYPLP